MDVAVHVIQPERIGGKCAYRFWMASDTQRNAGLVWQERVAGLVAVEVVGIVFGIRRWPTPTGVFPFGLRRQSVQPAVLRESLIERLDKPLRVIPGNVTDRV